MRTLNQSVIVLIASRAEDDDVGALCIYMYHRHLLELLA